jgi:hypothetical protein
MASRPGAQGRQARVPEAVRQHLLSQPAQAVTFGYELSAWLESKWPPSGMYCPRTWIFWWPPMPWSGARVIFCLDSGTNCVNVIY